MKIKDKSSQICAIKYVTGDLVAIFIKFRLKTPREYILRVPETFNQASAF